MSVSDSPVKSDALPPLDATAADLVARKTSACAGFWLQDEVATRMAQRLPLIKQAPRSWLDWQPMTGGLAAGALVQTAYPKADGVIYQPHSPDLQWVERAQKTPWWRRWRRPAVTYTSQALEQAEMVWCVDEVLESVTVAARLCDVFLSRTGQFERAALALCGLAVAAAPPQLY